MRAYAAGNVALANAPGNGVADDKAVYPFVPDMIRYYLGEEPLLEQVPTYVCARDDDRKYVLEHLDELVVKAVDEAGGYGMLMGPQSTRRRARRVPRAASSPSRAATSRSTASSCRPARPGSRERRRLEPRRVDLRPYILTRRERPAGCCPAGSRASRCVEGSYVVNSSQGGGSKDTWVQKEARVVISRVADHCFWFGRYLERAESTARMLQATRAPGARRRAAAAAAAGGRW